MGAWGGWYDGRHSDGMVGTVGVFCVAGGIPLALAGSWMVHSGPRAFGSFIDHCRMGLWGTGVWRTLAVAGTALARCLSDVVLVLPGCLDALCGWKVRRKASLDT